MTESRIKRLWKQQWANPKNSCLNCLHSSPPSPSLRKSPISMLEKNHHYNSPNSVSKKNNKLWRKPLPPDCPRFDFVAGATGGEKTLLQLDSQVNSIIPTRRDSRHYKQIPYFDTLLDRTCKSKRVVLLSEILRNK